MPPGAIDSCIETLEAKMQKYIPTCMTPRETDFTVREVNAVLELLQFRFQSVELNNLGSLQLPQYTLTRLLHPCSLYEKFTGSTP